MRRAKCGPCQQHSVCRSSCTCTNTKNFKLKVRKRHLGQEHHNNFLQNRIYSNSTLKIDNWNCTWYSWAECSIVSGPQDLVEWERKLCVPLRVLLQGIQVLRMPAMAGPWAQADLVLYVARHHSVVDVRKPRRCEDYATNVFVSIVHCCICEQNEVNHILFCGKSFHWKKVYMYTSFSISIYNHKQSLLDIAMVLIFQESFLGKIKKWHWLVDTITKHQKHYYILSTLRCVGIIKLINLLDNFDQKTNFRNRFFKHTYCKQKSDLILSKHSLE